MRRISQTHVMGNDPEAWRIVDGKLYLNYSKCVLPKWLRDRPNRIHRGQSVLAVTQKKFDWVEYSGGEPG